MDGEMEALRQQTKIFIQKSIRLMMKYHEIWFKKQVIGPQQKMQNIKILKVDWATLRSVGGKIFHHFFVRRQI